MITFNPVNPGPYLKACADHLQGNCPDQHRLVRKNLEILGKCVRSDDPQYQIIRSFVERKQKSTTMAEKVVARYVLYGCEAKDKVFPYSIVKKGCSRVAGTRYHPLAKNRVRVGDNDSDQNGYVINIPVVIRDDVDKTQRQITRLLNMIRDESFGQSPEESKRSVANRVVVVIGANRCKSLDKVKNRAFKEFVRNLEAYESLKVEVVGFLWEPKWSRITFPSVRKVRPYYSLLKKLNPELAEECRHIQESPGGAVMGNRVPYQEIREVIKNSNATKRSVKMLRTVNKVRDVYLSLIDSDAIIIRSDIGLFSHYDDLIRRFLPDVASTGYSISDDRNTILSYVVELDRRVRKAMGCVAYFPEPNMIVKILTGCDTVLESFIGGGDKSMRLESRRLVHNVVKNRKLDPERKVVFESAGPLVTQTPERFYTNPNQRRIAVSEIGHEKVLKTMHHSKQQSHVSPRAWGEQVGSWLAIDSKETQSIISKIFKVYDPITISLDKVYHPTIKKYNVKAHFQSMLENYKSYLALMDQVFALMENHDDLDGFMDHPEVLNFIGEHDDIEFALEQQMKLFLASYTGLLNKGVSKENIQLIVRKARASGIAIHEFFREILA